MVHTRLVILGREDGVPTNIHYLICGGVNITRSQVHNLLIICFNGLIKLKFIFLNLNGICPYKQINTYPLYGNKRCPFEGA